MAQIQKKFIAVNAVDETRIRLNNQGFMRARNAANSGDVNILKVDNNDIIVFASIPQAAGTPSAANDLTNFNYVQTQDNLRVLKAGDTMSGSLKFSAGSIGSALTAEQPASVFLRNTVNIGGLTMTGTSSQFSLKSFSFSGTSRLTAATALPINSGQGWAISFWMKDSSGQPQPTLMSTMNDPTNPNLPGFVVVGGGSGLKFVIGPQQINFGWAANNGDGAWHNIVLVYNPALAGAQTADGITAYMDGVAHTSRNVTSGGGNTYEILSSVPVKIGGQLGFGNGGQPSWVGKLDDLAFFNAVVLTGAEVTAIYNAGAPGNLALHSQYSKVVNYYYMGDSDDTFALVKDRKASDDLTGSNTSAPNITSDTAAGGGGAYDTLTTTAAKQILTGSVTVTGDVIIGGNATVNGTTTTINTANLDVTDKNISINNGGNDASALNAGLTVKRTSTFGSLIFNPTLFPTTLWGVGLAGAEVELVTAANGANRALSNLTSPTAINQHLLFGTDGTLNIGNTTNNRPQDVYAKRQILIGTSTALVTGVDAGHILIGNENTLIVRAGSSGGSANMTFQDNPGNDAGFNMDVGAWGKLYMYSTPGGGGNGSCFQFDMLSGKSDFHFMNATGSNSILWDTDGAGNIGAAAGANRVNNVYVKSVVEVPKVSGGFASGGTLELSSTSHATKGWVKAGDGSALVVGNAAAGFLSLYGATPLAQGVAVAAPGGGYYAESVANSSSVIVARANGAYGALALLANNDSLGDMQWRSYSTLSPSDTTNARIRVLADEAHTATAHGVRMEFETAQVTTNTRKLRMTLDSNGAMKMMSAGGANGVPNIIWNTDNIGSIGSTLANRPMNIYAATAMYSGDGSAAAPSISFDSDHASGLYRPAVSELSTALGGVEVAHMYRVVAGGNTFTTMNMVNNLSSVAVGCSVANVNGSAFQVIMEDPAPGGSGTVTTAANLHAKVFTNSNRAFSLDINKARGTVATPLVVAQNDNIFNIKCRAYTGASYVASAQMQVIVTDPTPSATAMGTKFDFILARNGTVAGRPVVRMDDAGSLIITDNTTPNLLFAFDNIGSVGAAAGNNRPLGVYAGTIVESPLVQGGFAAAGNLVLSSTSDATKGLIAIHDASTFVINPTPTNNWESSILAAELPTAFALVSDEGNIVNGPHCLHHIGSNTSSAGFEWDIVSARSTGATPDFSTPDYLSNNDGIYGLFTATYDGTSYDGRNAGRLRLRADENHTVSAGGTRFDIQLVNRGALTNFTHQFRSDGSLVIGTGTQGPNTKFDIILGTDGSGDLGNYGTSINFHRPNMIYAKAGLGVGTAAANDASATVQIDSTTKGFIMPRMSTANRDAIAAPANGLEIYNTDSNQPEFYNGTAWSGVGSNVELEETFNLSGTDISNQYIDLGHIAQGASASVNSIELVAGGVTQVKTVDYVINLTGGAGGNTRITFAGDLATGGPAALVSGDIVIVNYNYKT